VIQDVIFGDYYMECYLGVKSDEREIHEQEDQGGTIRTWAYWL
jgi:hypothetical protein